MPLTDPDSVVTEEDLAAFYQGIRPYLTKGGKQAPPQPIVYGIHIIANESDPDSKVEYLEDCAGFTPAYMDYENDSFNYGSWSNAFFMPKPCMLKYDGTVDYYLDPNDYTKKEDGITASDVANTSYAGNAMMEWPKIWLKIVPDTSKSSYEANIYISDTRIDEGYHDWPFHDFNGVSADHFYTSIYDSVYVTDRMRSISGLKPTSNNYASEDLGFAEANNPTGKYLWSIDTIAGIDLINVLLVLIGKSTDGQAIFGKGICKGGTGGNFLNGVHNNKGLFYGTNSPNGSTLTNCVKVFGMENWWGYEWTHYVGEVLVGGVRKRKLTYNTEDGSTTVGYNFTGTGYIDTNATECYGGSQEYITSMEFNNYGILPVYTDGSTSTNYCDILYYSNSGTRIPYRGCHSDSGEFYAGPFATAINAESDFYSTTIGSRLSCIPEVTQL